jgi:hypothetical protein
MHSILEFPDEFNEKSVKEAWGTCLYADFFQANQRYLTSTSELKRFVEQYTFQDLLSKLKSTAGYQALPPDLREESILWKVLQKYYY